jgi:hypothetical protein
MKRRWRDGKIKLDRACAIASNARKYVYLR